MEKYDIEVDDDDTVRYYKPGTKKLHRLDVPAVEYADGTKFWHVDGKRHRTDGPAIEWADGTNCWFIDDVKLTECQFKEKTAPVTKELTVEELTVAEIEKLLGHSVKVIG